jgi:DNA-binding SARP family transcriptional activator
VTAGREPTIELRVLGPLQVVCDGEEVALGSPKQRGVLAVLLISANRVVAVDRLVEELWGGEAPARAMASLQAYVSRLRRLLQPEGANRGRSDVLVTQSPGYLLRVDPESIDAVRFEHLTVEGTRLLAGGQADAALEVLDRALSLWRGPPYADFGFDEFAQAEIVRLEELRLAAAEARLWPRPSPSCASVPCGRGPGRR